MGQLPVQHYCRWLSGSLWTTPVEDRRTPHHEKLVLLFRFDYMIVNHLSEVVRIWRSRTMKFRLFPHRYEIGPYIDLPHT